MVIMTMFQQPESPIIFEQPNIKAIIDKKELGTGLLYISERTLCWKEQSGTGFCIEYPNISMHAITSDPNVYSTECIFIMTDGHISLPGYENEETSEDNDDEENSEADFSELLLVPANSDSIKTIFVALNECQALNPDPNDEVDEEEIEYEDAEEYDAQAGGDSEMNRLSNDFHNYSLNSHNEHLNGNGHHNLDDEQFEDAD